MSTGFCVLSRRIDLRIQKVGQIVDILVGSDHRRHELAIRRIGLVLMQHHDEVANIGAIAAVEQMRQRPVALQGMA